MERLVKMDRPSPDVVSIALPTPFPIGDVNVYLLEDGPLTLVDTGTNTKEAWDVLNKGLEAAGYRLQDIKQIVLTHFHVDHAGLTARLQLETGARLLAHPLTGVWLRNDQAFDELRSQFFSELYIRAGLDRALFGKIEQGYKAMNEYGCSCSIDEFLSDGDVLPGHPAWEVVYTPGHSQSQFSLYRQADQTMLLADHLISHSAATAVIEPSFRSGEKAVKALLQYRNELQKLRNRQIRIGLSGHGDPIFDHVSLIDKRLEVLDKRAQAVVDVLAGGEKTAFEIASALFPNRRSNLPLIISETLGHLECLEEEGRIQRTTVQTVDRYSLPG